MGEFSITHWIIILAILLLFFGPSKLPGLGASLGKAIRGFKAGLSEVDPTVDNPAAPPKPPEQLNASPTSPTVEPLHTKEPQKKS